MQAIDLTRRTLLAQGAVVTSLNLTGAEGAAAAQAAQESGDGLTRDGLAGDGLTRVTLRINGTAHHLALEPRVTLLDALREQAGLTGTKKGCARGSCGACTVLIDGRRVNACLTLAIRSQGQDITTIEGLAQGDRLHPMQAAFCAHDALQCGYCTPGQIMSAVALVAEGHGGSAAEIREWMAGNLCRCGAYNTIVDAVASVAQAG